MFWDWARRRFTLLDDESGYKLDRRVTGINAEMNFAGFDIEGFTRLVAGCRASLMFEG